MHARIDGGQAKLLTRTGVDWSHRYRHTRHCTPLPVKSAYAMPGRKDNLE
jgi:bifunctional non-homologous end joining protein LigD